MIFQLIYFICVLNKIMSFLLTYTVLCQLRWYSKHCITLVHNRLTNFIPALVQCCVIAGIVISQ